MASGKPPVDDGFKPFVDRCSHSSLLGLMALSADRRERCQEQLLEQARFLGIVEASS